MVDQGAVQPEDVAIVVPVYRPVDDSGDRASLDSIASLPAECPRFIIKPRGLGISLAGFDAVDFQDSCFLSVDTYSRLLLSDDFYLRFNDFEFILIVQLDALILKPDLERWLRTGADYIGAPWFEGDDPAAGPSRVGNGGLSLRRVQAFRRVLGSRSIPSMGPSSWLRLVRCLPDLGTLSPLRRMRKALSVLRSARVGVERYCRSYSLNEDHFWSDRALLFDPTFAVASVEEGLRFAFERFPRTCLELAGGRLPFGCHAWMKHDPGFWREHLPAAVIPEVSA